ncbi:hypothetical protein EI94DRAFT_1731582 [Lactarius quietus]|nr:hypothetical protein EI94DRAFT_1731582 [Lactarius quietus]
MSLADNNLVLTLQNIYFNSIANLAPLVQFVWTPGNQGWLTLAILLNRYLPIFGHIPLAVSYFTGQRGLHLYHEVLGIFIQSVAGLLCMIRVYALYGRSRRVLGVLLSVGATAILVTCWGMVASRHNKHLETILVISSLPGCNQFTPERSLIFSLTLYKAFTMGRGIRLLNVIVRDGRSYSTQALFIMNLTNILILLVRPHAMHRLSITLVSRLMLNLRAHSSTQAGLPSSIESERRFQAGTADSFDSTGETTSVSTSHLDVAVAGPSSTRGVRPRRKQDLEP